MTWSRYLMGGVKLEFWKTGQIVTWCASLKEASVRLHFKIRALAQMYDVTVAAVQYACGHTRGQQSAVLRRSLFQPRSWFSALNAHKLVTAFCKSILSIHHPLPILFSIFFLCLLLWKQHRQSDLAKKKKKKSQLYCSHEIPSLETCTCIFKCYA